MRGIKLSLKLVYLTQVFFFALYLILYNQDSYTIINSFDSILLAMQTLFSLVTTLGFYIIYSQGKSLWHLLYLLSLLTTFFFFPLLVSVVDFSTNGWR